ncbi:MAG: hypothetical protein KAR24_03195 [Candidatus Pacebacteria bacterium]|nr:hypothetical protein [Candidatus Paceibacterota bacterium]
MNSVYTNVDFGLDLFFTVLPILLVFLAGFYKPKCLLRYFSKVETWAMVKKRKYTMDSTNDWKYLMVPITFILTGTTALVAKMIKDEHWRAAVFFGISYFVLSFFFVLIVALIYGAVVFVISILLIAVVFVLLAAIAGPSE